MDSSKFGRIDVQMAKQIIVQKVRDAERDMIYKEFSSRIGEVISGIARRMERGALVVDLGKTEAVLPPKEQIPGEVFRFGDRVQAFILDIVQSPNRGPQIVLSRSAPQYLMKLFETEVPEVYEGIVTIKGAARDPGSRAKIAVYSKDSDVDPVGACVGIKGSRVQNVVLELRGEKIDIIPWSDAPSSFVVNALAPAQISKVILDERNHAMEIVVPDDQLALAIGKRGQNVRLASRLTGWSLDIVSESQMAEKMNRAKKSLTAIDGVSDTLALSLYHSGYDTARSVAEADLQDLSQVPGFEGGRAQTVKEKAKIIAEEEARVKAEKEAQEAAAAKEALQAEEQKKAIVATGDDEDEEDE